MQKIINKKYSYLHCKTPNFHSEFHLYDVETSTLGKSLNNLVQFQEKESILHMFIVKITLESGHRKRSCL